MPNVSDGLRARRNATERDLMITALYEREARDLRLSVVRSDGSLDDVVERAAAHLRPVVERLPRGGDLTAARRNENDVLATQVRLYAESLLPTVLEDRPLAFACECGASGCTAEPELTLEEYEAVSAAGDRSPLRRPTP
jgi:hypothetical protein